jgi:RNA polymerase sigma-70 factor (ECF subfamily)
MGRDVMQIPSTHLSLLLALQVDGRRDDAWVVFQARYQDVILGWCRRRQLSPEDAEDLTQEVLLKLFEALSRGAYDPAKGRFRGLLKAVVNNAISDCWRRQQRRPEPVGVGGTSFLERLGDLAGPESAGELSGAIEQRAKAVATEVFRRVRARLKETTWQAFAQTMIEGRPAAEVAAALGLTVGTVFKAKDRVKRMLEEEYLYAHANAGDANPLPGRECPPEVPA